MLTKSGVKLLDFGLTKILAGETDTETSDAPTQQRDLTKEQAIIGTLQYMAPEQLEGGEADARTDLWAFGCVVYEMVTGKKVFEGKSQASLITAIMSSEPPPPSSVESMSPAGLDYVVETCLSKDPDDRWQTARDLSRELKRVDAGETAPSESTPTIAPQRPTVWQRPVLAIAASVAITVVALRWTGEHGVPRSRDSGGVHPQPFAG